MMSTQLQQVEAAAKFLTRVLSGFIESGLYEEYKEEERFTDEEYERAIDTLATFGRGTTRSIQ